jgi:sigma-B regulation protein RsbU (phosphoserine phosphatase)
MKFFSIRWKLSLALVGLSLGLVSVYVLIASRTFETDKISYVFDSQQRQMEEIARGWTQKVQEGLFLGRSILSTYDPAKAGPNIFGQKLFAGQRFLKALELSDPKTRIVVAAVLTPGLELPPAEMSSPAVDQVNLSHFRGSEFFVTVLQGQVSGELVFFRALLDLEGTLPKRKEIDFFISHLGQILLSNSEKPDSFSPLLSDLAKDTRERTQVMTFQGSEYLVSSLPLKIGDLQLVALASKSVALGALGTLFHRSLVFLFFSSCVTIFLALILSGGLTKTLAVLAEAAVRIGRGDFTQTIVVNSNDEIGILSSAFVKMSLEIQRLLFETRDKARMEVELRTASLVQETLLPKSPTFLWNDLSLSGGQMNATECGGDWWYYLESRDCLIIGIADATGHGTPAALMTAAARSAFSIFEKSRHSMDEIMSKWNDSVLACSGGKIFMTAQLVEIQKFTGRVRIINAGHEWPFIFQKTEKKTRVNQVLDLKMNAMLGETRTEPWQFSEFQLDQNATMVLYTDGVLAVEIEAGEKLSERRFAKAIAKELQEDSSPETLVERMKDFLRPRTSAAHLEDDVTIVAIHRS